MARFRWVMAAVILVCLAPLISAFSAIGIASLFGCVVNEAGVTPCPTPLGEAGGTLSTMFVLGWFGVVTAPLAALLLVAWPIVEVAAYARRRARSRSG